MDLSKLPKLSESPPTPKKIEYANPVVPSIPRQLTFGDIGVDLLIATIVGAIFVMLGAPFGGWLIASIRGVPYATGVNWLPPHPLANQPVELFDLQGGTAWMYMGQWVLGAGLLIGGILLAGAAVSPRFAKLLILTAALFSAIGTLANILAVIMQVKVGFTQPLMSMVGILVGGMMTFFLVRHAMDLKITPATDPNRSI